MRWITIIGCSTLICLFGCSAMTEPTSESDRESARPELATGFWADHKLAVTVQIFSEAGDVQFTVAEWQDGKVDALVSRSNRGGIRRATSRIADSPELRRLIREFRQLNVAPTPPETLLLEPATMRIWSTTISGASSFELTYDPDSNVSSESQAALLHWAMDAFKTLTQTKPVD